MRVGLLGGTFDPIHLGHLRAAETAREGLGLDLVAFVPAAVPPHRRGPMAPPRDRYAMAELASSSHPAFEAWDLELRREGPSYTVDTLETLRAERPGDDLVLVVGSDTWPEMTGWREPERLFALAEVAVLDRPGQPAPEVAPPFRSSRGASRVEGPTLPISATMIRERLKAGESVRYLVPGEVLGFIAERELYS